MHRGRRPIWLAASGVGLLAALGMAAPAAVAAHGSVPPAPAWPDVLWAWTITPLPVIGVIGAALGYWWLVRRVARRHPRNPVAVGRHWAWYGGLAAIVAALLSEHGLFVNVVGAAAVSVVGIWICGASARRFGVHDHPAIVWDEIAGMTITLLAAPRGWTWSWAVCAFVLFRRVCVPAALACCDSPLPKPPSTIRCSAPRGSGPHARPIARRGIRAAATTARRRWPPISPRNACGAASRARR